MLSITNGDVAANILRRTEFGGNVVPWRDLLHEGPVPAGLSLEELRPVRAKFLSNRDLGCFPEILRAMEERDRALQEFRRESRVVLWFEHDLYDQLQLLQILAWFHDQPLGETRLELVCIDSHEEVPSFVGLGQLSPLQLGALIHQAQEVEQDHLALAAQGWQAFRASSPRSLVEFLSTDTSLLPFLEAALWRHLEQLPSLGNGLSLTEQRVLEEASRGATSAGHLFEAQQRLELAPYLGDSTFWYQLQELAAEPAPLLKIETRGDGKPFEDRVSVTDLGLRVLGGEDDRVAAQGIDRWWGGLHQKGLQVRWRWDGENRSLVEELL